MILSFDILNNNNNNDTNSSLTEPELEEVQEKEIDQEHQQDPNHDQDQNQEHNTKEQPNSNKSQLSNIEKKDSIKSNNEQFFLKSSRKASNEINIKISQSTSDFEVSHQEDQFLQKDLLQMINFLSGNSQEEDEKDGSVNNVTLSNGSIPFNMPTNNSNSSNLSEEQNKKVIDIDNSSSNNSILDSKHSNADFVSKKQNKKERDIQPINHTDVENNTANENDIDNDSFYSLSKCTINSKRVINKQIALNKYKNLSNIELAKWAYFLSKDQKTCLYLQDKLDKEPEMTEMIYHHIKQRIVDMMFGGFSNYLIQKIIDKLTNKHIKEIIYQIIRTNSFTILGLDPHGTRVIQKLIHKIKDTNQLLYLMTNSIMQNINDFIIDSNANHIIIHLVTVLGSPWNQSIFDYFISHILEVSHNKNSCCALQKCILIATDQQKKELFNCIGHNSRKMITDDFGNYVLQFIIPLCGDNVLYNIIQSFSDDPAALALNKYASNVIEKCIEYCSMEMRLVIIKKYLNQMSIDSMLVNKYGKYVLNAIISHSTEPILSIIFAFIRNSNQKSIGNKTTQFFLFQMQKKYPQYFQMEMNYPNNNTMTRNSTTNVPLQPIQMNRDKKKLMTLNKGSNLINACNHTHNPLINQYSSSEMRNHQYTYNNTNSNSNYAPMNMNVNYHHNGINEQPYMNETSPNYLHNNSSLHINLNINNNYANQVCDYYYTHNEYMKNQIFYQNTVNY